MIVARANKQGRLVSILRPWPTFSCLGVAAAEMFLNSLCDTSDELLLSALGFNSERELGCVLYSGTAVMCHW